MNIKRCSNCEYSIVYEGSELICVSKKSAHKNQYVEPKCTCEHHKEVAKGQ